MLDETRDDLPALSRPKKARSERELPTTTYAVLGMLALDEMSGYDLGKLIDRSIAHFGFKPAKSQVYAALHRLVDLGWASEREVAQHDRPDKRLYRITPEGEWALRGWLESPGVEPEVVRSPFLLKVFFGDMVPRETLLAQVKEAHRIAVEELEVLEQIERDVCELDRANLRFPSLVLRYGLAHNRASVAWTLEMLRELEQQPPAPDHDDLREPPRRLPGADGPSRPKRPRRKDR
jgi:PadR family transcriptional regulator AphA